MTKEIPFDKNKMSCEHEFNTKEFLTVFFPRLLNEPNNKDFGGMTGHTRKLSKRMKEKKTHCDRLRHFATILVTLHFLQKQSFYSAMPLEQVRVHFY
jgi:hypothetical protein